MSPTDAVVWLFVLVFLVTAVITLGGMIGKIKVDPFYERKLFGVLLLQLIGVVITFGVRVFSAMPPQGPPDLPTLLTQPEQGWDWQYANRCWRGNLVFTKDPQGAMELNGSIRDFSRPERPDVVRFNSKGFEPKTASSGFPVEVRRVGEGPSQATMTLRPETMLRGTLSWTGGSKVWAVYLTPEVAGWQAVLTEPQDSPSGR